MHNHKEMPECPKIFHSFKPYPNRPKQQLKTKDGNGRESETDIILTYLMSRVLI